MWRRAAVMAQYQSRIGELEAWKAHMTAKYKRLEDRRAMDLEGFNRDVTALRKALGLTERKLHQMRLVLRLDVRPLCLQTLSYPQLPARSVDPTAAVPGEAPKGEMLSVPTCVGEDVCEGTTQDDDRLDKLLEMLEKKAPGPEKKKKSTEGVKLGAKPRPASARFADMRTQQVRMLQQRTRLGPEPEPEPELSSTHPNPPPRHPGSRRRVRD